MVSILDYQQQVSGDAGVAKQEERRKSLHQLCRHWDDPVLGGGLIIIIIKIVVVVVVVFVVVVVIVVVVTEMTQFSEEVWFSF